MAMCEIGLYLANKYNRAVATNFPFNTTALWEYLIFRKYWNLCKSLQEGRFYYFPPDSLVGLLSVKHAEILFDEAPIFLSNRDYAKNNRELLRRLGQVRKKKSDLLYASQDWTSTDPDLRKQTHYVMNCEGALIPDLEGYPRLVAKDISIHEKLKYEKWYQSPKRDRFLFRKKHQLKRWTKPVVCSDLMLFELYDSTLDLADDLEEAIPENFQKIYFKDRLDPFNEQIFVTPIDGYLKGYKCYSEPPNCFILNIDVAEPYCKISKVLNFYWRFLVNYPAPLFPILQKLPRVLHKLKIVNLGGWDNWKGNYAKIW